MIKLKNATKKFEDRYIIENINFEFESMNTYIIVGESGIGKTTLLNLLCGYLELDEGDIQKSTELNVQYLFQDQLLFTNMTVIENLYIKYCSRNEKALDISYYLDMFIDVLKKFSLEDLANKIVSLLSGGERQRIQLAQIALFDPDVILMDEPTSNLDKSNKNKIAKLINTIFNEKLIIIVTHDDPRIFGDSYIVTLEEGRLNIVEEYKVNFKNG